MNLKLIHKKNKNKGLRKNSVNPRVFSNGNIVLNMKEKYLGI